MNRLARELGLADLLTGVSLARPEADDEGRGDPEDPLAKLSGILAIHSLTEPAAIRAREIVCARSPGCEVRLNHDHVGTLELKELAQKADLFVMVTASSKHAATGFIETHRPQCRPLLRPSGKGTSSILQVLAEHLRSQGPG